MPLPREITKDIASIKCEFYTKVFVLCIKWEENCYLCSAF